MSSLINSATAPPVDEIAEVQQHRTISLSSLLYFALIDTRSRKYVHRQSDKTATHLAKSCTCHIPTCWIMNSWVYTVLLKRVWVTTVTWQFTTWKPDQVSVIKEELYLPSYSPHDQEWDTVKLQCYSKIILCKTREKNYNILNFTQF